MPTDDLAPDPPPRRQVNVRLPEDLVDAIDARRVEMNKVRRSGEKVSRDKWFENAARFALAQRPIPRPVQTPGGRTAPPPHRRP